MTSDLLEENEDLRKQVEELKEQLEKHKWNNIFLEDCAVYDKEIAEEYKTLQERIADLKNELRAEKEYSATLRKEIDEYTNSHTLCTKYKDLEKENAELKLKLEVLEGQTPWKDIKDKSEVIGQLTKAKEIIKELVRVEYADFTNGDYSNELSKVLEQAEQFLKEKEQ